MEDLVVVAQVDPEGACGSTRGEAGDRSRGHWRCRRHAAVLRRGVGCGFVLDTGSRSGSLERVGFCRGR